VRLLVTKYSCDLNARDSNGDTPFTCAGLGGSVECVEVLINEFHCDINTKDYNGQTILHHAYFYGHINLLKLFVAKYGYDLTVCEGRKCVASKDSLNVISDMKNSWNGRSGSGEEVVPFIPSHPTFLQ
jgi:ankyrin repeat protein